MSEKKGLSVDYGNWVPLKMILVPAGLGAACLGSVLLSWIFIVPAAAFLAVAGYFAVSYRCFSRKGGDLQGKVRGIIMERISWSGEGRVLDIGCGNGPLSVELSLRWPKAEVVGLDFWGPAWDYSIAQCERNADLSGVSDRVRFVRGSAAALPFPDESFDLVVSNLVFHEVKDAADKKLCFKEALRVLKPGGRFVIQDLLLLKNLYGSREELLTTLNGWGAEKAEFFRTCDEPSIPSLVKLPFMVGSMALIKGLKSFSSVRPAARVEGETPPRNI